MLPIPKIIEDMNTMFGILGYKPNNGKPWTGYVDAEGKGRQPVTWQTAKMVGLNIWSELCQHYKLFGIVANSEQLTKVRKFAKENQKTLGYTNMLVYSKKTKTIKAMRYIAEPMSTK